MKQHTLSWKGKDTYHTLEKCTVAITDGGVDIRGNVNGVMDAIAVQVSYLIHTDTNWRTTAFEITYVTDGTSQTLNYSGDTRGNWLKDGIPQPQLRDCIEIDITATPFTNTLAVNRLKLNIGQSQKIKVLYIDILENTVTVTEQVYNRLSEDMYRFSTGDFKADIRFDRFGFVVDYPGLFERAG